MAAQPLKWKFSDGVYAAHTSYGVYFIEQHRGRFRVELWLGKSRHAKQDLSVYPSLAKAMAGTQRDHRAFLKLDQP
jgi:hypothetical protein